MVGVNIAETMLARARAAMERDELAETDVGLLRGGLTSLDDIPELRFVDGFRPRFDVILSSFDQDWSIQNGNQARTGLWADGIDLDCNLSSVYIIYPQAYLSQPVSSFYYKMIPDQMLTIITTT